jgi:hypothetical protein
MNSKGGSISAERRSRSAALPGAARHGVIADERWAIADALFMAPRDPSPENTPHTAF